MKQIPNLYKPFFLSIFIFIIVACLTTAPVVAKDIGAFIPGKGWVKQQGNCPGDSTPLQFIPKTAPDTAPLIDEFKKYPRCVHCGMNRLMWHHSRHLVHYDDGLAVGTCSVRCLAVNLSLNLDRGIKAIYAADFGAKGKPKPLINADDAVYLIGSKLKGTMTKNSKMAFSSESAARASMEEHGGRVARFSDALLSAYNEMAEDTIMIRKRRAEKQKRMMKKKAAE